MKPNLCVDFDGTICVHEFPNIGKVKDGAKEALTLARTLGYSIIISSCRTCKFYPEVFAQKLPDGSVDRAWLENTLERSTVVAMKEFLDREEIPYDEIDDGSQGKPFAAAYIDDKGIRFQDNWAEIAWWLEVNRPGM